MGRELRAGSWELVSGSFVLEFRREGAELEDRIELLWAEQCRNPNSVFKPGDYYGAREERRLGDLVTHLFGIIQYINSVLRPPHPRFFILHPRFYSEVLPEYTICSTLLASPKPRGQSQKCVSKSPAPPAVRPPRYLPPLPLPPFPSTTYHLMSLKSAPQRNSPGPAVAATCPQC